MCGVSRSSYNERKRAEKKNQEKLEEKKKEDNAIKKLMRSVMNKLGYVPGERGFKTFLWRDYDLNVGRKRIKNLMREMNLFASVPKKDAYKGNARYDHICTAPENLVNQNFRIAPRKIICTDITYLYFGPLRTTIYLCIFRDAYTKEILGWALRNLMTTELIREAYDRMMKKHGKELKNPGVIIHSDQGCQYLSTTFKKLLEDDGFLQSVSARGYSYDNAIAESFFSRLKTAILSPVALCRNLSQAQEMVEGYINKYNEEIYQLDLAGLTPHEFYLYCMTGVYPCDSYFGVKATELRPLEALIRDILNKAEEKARKMREIYQKRSRAAQLLKKDPVLITLEDQKLILRMIDRYTRHRDEMTIEIERLKEVLAKATAAQEYFESMTEEERKVYNTPSAWQNDSHLQYIYDMGGLF